MSLRRNGWVFRWCPLVLPCLFLLAANLRAADPARDARWRDDLAFLATELPQRHINLFSKISKADFDRAVADLSQAIPNLSDAEVITGMARIVALAGDAHTSLSLTQAAAGLRQLPMAFQWFEDGLHVVAAASDYRRALAARVLQIGDGTPEQALAAVSTVISHENDPWVRHKSVEYFRLSEVLRALKVTAASDPVRLLLLAPSGERFSLDVAPAGSGAATLLAAPDPARGFIPLYRQNPGLNYWFVYLESSRTLYFRYNRCEEMPDRPFAGFAAQLFAVFDSRPVDRLVLDLRDNPGGSSRVVQPFFDGLQNRAARLGSPTRLFAIIGRGTFSAAMDNAEVIKDAEVNQGLSFIKIYGEPTGGKPRSFGEVQSLALPNSKLLVSYSTKYFDSPFDTDSLLPDVFLSIFSEDYFARHDPFLAAVLAEAVN